MNTDHASPERQKRSLAALLSRADTRRAVRAEDRPVQVFSWDGREWAGRCEGAKSQTYNVIIRLLPGRAFNCTCLDHRKMRGSVGPCKHVISLARQAQVELAPVGQLELPLENA